MRYARWIALAAVVVLLSGGALYAQIRTPEVSGTPIETGAPQPVVEGNRILDARSGREFVPRGVNWSSFEYACAQGWGMSSLDNIVAQDPAAEQAEAIARWGANTVRVPLNQDCWLGTRGAPVSDQYVERTVEGYRAEVHDLVTALNRAGMVVILDLHSRKRIGQPEFGNLAMPDSESIAFWTSVATAYQDNPSVLFDAFNEPYSRYNASSTRFLFDLTWKCWRDGGCRAPIDDDQTATVARVTYQVQGMAAMVTAIRNAGATQPILLGGLDYANDLEHWLEFAPDDDQLIAAFHSYDFKECGTEACWNDVIGELADSVPVLTSELGADDPVAGYVTDYLAWADEHNLGALFWVWADHPSDPMALVADDDTARPTPYGRIARDWMTGHLPPEQASEKASEKAGEKSSDKPGDKPSKSPSK